jgi:hypothetical protein
VHRLFGRSRGAAIAHRSFQSTAARPAQRFGGARPVQLIGDAGLVAHVANGERSPVPSGSRGEVIALCS